MGTAHLFTSESARAAQKKGFVVRMANIAKRKAAPHWTFELAKEKGEFACAQLATLRTTIDRVQGLLAKTADAERLLALAKALAALLEEERILSGRTLPGRAIEPKPAPAAPAPVATTLPDGA